VNRIVLVDDIDGISLGRELDMYCTTTVVRYKTGSASIRSFGSLPLLRLRALALLGFVGAHAVPVLDTVGTYVFEPGAVSAFLVVGLSLIVFETVN
jgi:hypothetical protein